MGILAAVLSPSGAACALAVLGLLARFWRRRPGLSWGLLSSAAVIALVFSSGMVATALMSPLEYAYPTLGNASAYPQVDRIVVLTAWATEDGRIHFRPDIYHLDGTGFVTGQPQPRSEF